MARLFFEVALIAIARKVIVLDHSKYDDLSVLAIAALIIALAGALLSRRTRAQTHGHPVHQRPGGTSA